MINFDFWRLLLASSTFKFHFGLPLAGASWAPTRGWNAAWIFVEDWKQISCQQTKIRWQFCLFVGEVWSFESSKFLFSIFSYFQVFQKFFVFKKIKIIWKSKISKNLTKFQKMLMWNLLILRLTVHLFKKQNFKFPRIFCFQEQPNKTLRSFESRNLQKNLKIEYKCARTLTSQDFWPKSFSDRHTLPKRSLHLPWEADLVKRKPRWTNPFKFSRPMRPCTRHVAALGKGKSRYCANAELAVNRQPGSPPEHL